MVPGYEILSAMRITRVIQALQDKRDMPQELKFVGRTPMTPALDGEIIGRWINRLQIADLVADDARALTYTSGKLQTESTTIPNIKIGRHLTQEQLNQLETIARNPGYTSGALAGTEIVGDIVNNIADDLRIDILQRVEQLLVSMHIDQVNYIRGGMNFTGSWGMPSQLKITPTYYWTDPTNATPVNDVWNAKRNAAILFGANYNRITMSTSAFLAMIATTEYQNKARTNLPLYLNFTNLPQGNINQQRTFATNVLGVDEIELYDARYWTQDAAGTQTSAPYLPINKVILSETANDNNAAVQDFANGVVTESVVSGFLPNTGVGMIGRFGQGVRGPVGYATAPSDLNPPNLTIWGVMRGYPRKLRLQANACLTVMANAADTIPIYEVF